MQIQTAPNVRWAYTPQSLELCCRIPFGIQMKYLDGVQGGGCKLRPGGRNGGTFLILHFWSEFIRHGNRHHFIALGNDSHSVPPLIAAGISQTCYQFFLQIFDRRMRRISVARVARNVIEKGEPNVRQVTSLRQFLTKS